MPIRRGCSSRWYAGYPGGEFCYERTARELIRFQNVVRPVRQHFVEQCDKLNIKALT
jgi:hypothetical protein